MKGRELIGVPDKLLAVEDEVNRMKRRQCLTLLGGGLLAAGALRV
jgi:hypothetical protein